MLQCFAWIFWSNMINMPDWVVKFSDIEWVLSSHVVHALVWLLEWSLEFQLGKHTFLILHRAISVVLPVSGLLLAQKSWVFSWKCILQPIMFVRYTPSIDLSVCNSYNLPPVVFSQGAWESQTSALTGDPVCYSFFQNQVPHTLRLIEIRFEVLFFHSTCLYLLVVCS